MALVLVLPRDNAPAMPGAGGLAAAYRRHALTLIEARCNTRRGRRVALVVGEAPARWRAPPSDAAASTSSGGRPARSIRRAPPSRDRLKGVRAGAARVVHRSSRGDARGRRARNRTPGRTTAPGRSRRTPRASPSRRRPGASERRVEQLTPVVLALVNREPTEELAGKQILVGRAPGIDMHLGDLAGITDSRQFARSRLRSLTRGCLTRRRGGLSFPRSGETLALPQRR
jgi:hypothetical protein